MKRLGELWRSWWDDAWPYTRVVCLRVRDRQTPIFPPIHARIPDWPTTPAEEASRSEHDAVAVRTSPPLLWRLGLLFYPYVEVTVVRERRSGALYALAVGACPTVAGIGESPGPITCYKSAGPSEHALRVAEGNSQVALAVTAVLAFWATVGALMWWRWT